MFDSILSFLQRFSSNIGKTFENREKRHDLSIQRKKFLIYVEKLNVKKKKNKRMIRYTYIYVKRRVM